MASEDFEYIKANVERLTDAYVNDTEDPDRVMNLMRRVLDGGVDAVLPLMLAQKKHAAHAGFMEFSNNIIKVIMNEDARGTPEGAGKNIGDVPVVKRALARISKLYNCGEEETARGLEEVLAIIGLISPTTLEKTSKAKLSPDAAAILARVMKEVKAAAKNEDAPLPYESKLGFPRRPAPSQAPQIIAELGKKKTNKN